MNAVTLVRAALLGALAAACAAPQTGSGAGNGGFQYYGIHHVSWSPYEYTYATATASRNDLAATNANWAGVLVTWYQANITASTIAASNTQTPTDAAVEQAITELHGKGIKVMLKPHVDVLDGTWRGNINPVDVDGWFSSYIQFIVKYAQMAAAQNVEMFCIGTELKTVSGSANQVRWIGVINAIRAVYSGPLTYAANASAAGDEFTSVSFWDQLDLLGMDAYFPLTGQSDPTLEQLVAAWHGNVNKLDLVSTVLNFAASHAKPVIFTEIGYMSTSGTNTAPWNYSLAGSYDPTEQRNCMDAMFTAFSPYSSRMLGVFWWDWPVAPPAPGDLSYNPRGKPAASLLLAWQSAVDPHNAVTNDASFSTAAIAPGTIVNLWGASLASGTQVFTQFPLALAMQGTTVTINGIPAPLFFVSPQQVNAQMPFEVSPGVAIAEVDSSSGIALTRFNVAAQGPGIFTTNGGGTGDGALLNAVTFAPVTSSQPIAAGDYIAIYCTGLGAVVPAGTTGAAAATPPPATAVTPQVQIDGQNVPVFGSVLAPGYVGLYQVNAQVPANLAPGAHQLQLVVAGTGSNIVTLATK
jgi:uncharacterized protein (TIGR03437 family)